MEIRTIEIDWVPSEKSDGSAEVSRMEILEVLQTEGISDVKVELMYENGPTGCPMFHLTGTLEELEVFKEFYASGEDLETFLI